MRDWRCTWKEKSFYFVSAELALPQRGNANMFNFDVRAFKELLVQGFTPRIRLYLGGSVLDASLGDIMKWAKQGFDLEGSRNIDTRKVGKIAVVSGKNLSEKDKSVKHYKHQTKVVRFDSDSTDSG